MSNVNFNTYLISAIVLNDVETWPREWILFLEKNRKELEKYIFREKEIEINKKKLDDVTVVNEYTSTKKKIEAAFSNLFFNERYEFYCFHATRLMNYEVDNIQREGLKNCSKEAIRLKIENLLNHKLINKTEYELIISSNFLNVERQKLLRENRLYFIFGNQDIRYVEVNRSDIWTFLSNYGGEVIHRGLESIGNETLISKLNKNSKPYLVICKMKMSILKEQFEYCLFNTFIKSYFDKKVDKIENEFYICGNCVDCVDIVELDDSSKTIKTKRI